MLGLEKNFEDFKFWPFVLLSFLFHGSLFLLGVKGISLGTQQKEQTAISYPIEIMKLQDIDHLKKEISRQLVNSDQGELGKEAKKSFLGEKTQSFKKQTAARKVAPYRKNPMKTKWGLRELGNASGYSGIGKKGKVLSDNGGKSALQEIASNNDFVDDIPLGDFTKLNTTEYKHFGFYQRIRERLEQYWGRKLREKARLLRQQGRGIASGGHYVTSLMITLNNRGKIIRIYLKGSSGVHEFDEAAIHSFNQAGPFPNPPKDALRKDGTALVKWNFVVQS